MVKRDWKSPQPLRSSPTKVSHTNSVGVLSCQQRKCVLAKESSIRLIDKVEVGRLIVRQWDRFVSGAERKILDFVFSSTIDWDKREDKLKYSHFVNGVGSHLGTGLSLSTVRRAIASLIEKGMLEVRHTIYGMIYRINLQWEQTMLAEPKTRRADTTGMATPKRLQSVQNEHSRMSKMNTFNSKEHTEERIIPVRRSATPLYGRAPLISVEEQQEEASAIQEIPQPPAPLSPSLQAFADKVQSTIRKGVERMSRKPAKGPAQPFKLWQAAFVSAFPEMKCASWAIAGREARQCSNLLAGLEKGDKAEFLTFVVRDWRLVIASHFKWMTNNPAPDYPDVGFAVRFKAQFYDAFNRQERLRVLAQAGSMKEHYAIQRMFDHGLTAEQVQKDLDKNDRRVVAAEKLERMHVEEDAHYREIAKTRETMQEMARKMAAELKKNDPGVTGKFVPKTIAVRPKSDAFYADMDELCLPCYDEAV